MKMEERNEIPGEKDALEKITPQTIHSLRYQIITDNNYASLVNGIMSVCEWWRCFPGISSNDVINILESITRYYKEKNDRA